MSLQDISNIIDVVPNFPKEGIFFRDISQLLADYKLREKTFDYMFDLVKDLNIDYVAGLDPRGFIFGSAIATRLKCGFVMLKKLNKMTKTVQVRYGLETNQDVLTIHHGLIEKGKKVLIVDDLLATGGSLSAGCKLIEKIECDVVGCLCFIELTGLSNRSEKLNDYKIYSLLKYLYNSENKNL